MTTVEVALPTVFSRLKSKENHPIKNYKLITQLRNVIESMAEEIAYWRNETKDEQAYPFSVNEVIAEYFGETEETS